MTAGLPSSLPFQASFCPPRLPVSTCSRRYHSSLCIRKSRNLPEEAGHCGAQVLLFRGPAVSGSWSGPQDALMVPGHGSGHSENGEAPLWLRGGPQSLEGIPAESSAISGGKGWRPRQVAPVMWVWWRETQRRKGGGSVSIGLMETRKVPASH